MSNSNDRREVQAQIVAVSVGKSRDVEHHGRQAHTAIWKSPVTGPVRAEGVNIEGDEQADRQSHGGYDKAVYAYAEEDRKWWEAELDRTLGPGAFGEHLTTSGIDLTGALVGEQWRIGSTLLEVSEPRLPCWRLNLRMDDKKFNKQFSAAGRPGTYLRIVEPGVLETGDKIAITHIPNHNVTIGDVAQMYLTRHDVERILAVEQISDAWKSWAARLLEQNMSRSN